MIESGPTHLSPAPTLGPPCFTPGNTLVAPATVFNKELFREIGSPVTFQARTVTGAHPTQALPGSTATTWLDNSPQPFFTQLLVLLVFEDAQSHRWATELCDRVVHNLGQGFLQIAACSMRDFAAPNVLAAAAQLARRADVVLVSASSASAELYDLRRWVDQWLPHRKHGDGALIAVNCDHTLQGATALRLQDYLQAVAAQAGMRFAVHQPSPAPASPKPTPP